MSDTPPDRQELWRQLGDPVVLPKVARVGGGSFDIPALYGGGSTPPTLQVQLDTQSGQHLLLPLTVEAARELVLVVAGALQARGYSLEREEDEPDEPQS